MWLPRLSERARFRLHTLATVGWAVMTPVAMVTDLKQSLPFLVGISMYAIVVGHWGAVEAALPPER